MMKSLLIKDLLTLRRYGRTLGMVAVFYIVFGIINQSGSMLSGMLTLLFTMMTITACAYDEQAHWHEYALTLPVSRHALAGSKYLLALAMGGAGALLSLVFSVVTMLISDGAVDVENLLIVYVMLLLGLLVAAILLPLMFRFGVEKSRIWMMLIFFVPSILAMLAPQLGLHFSAPDEATIKMVLILALPVVSALYWLSYLLSSRIMDRKEF